MTPVDVVGDTGGFLAGLQSAVEGLVSLVASLLVLVEVLIVAAAILIAVEVARGVMRR